MRSNRSRDTAPELAIRRLVHGSGLRYRVDIKPIPDLKRRGDLIFTRAQVVVFVDGCYWHGCPKHFKTPKTNSAYWLNKIEKNIARDHDTNVRLEAAGWTVLRYWEHEDSDRVANDVISRVRKKAARIGTGRAISEREDDGAVS